MFAVPAAKRVRRSDLRESSTSPHSSPEPESVEVAPEDLRRIYANSRFTLDLDDVVPGTTDASHKDSNAETIENDTVMADAAAEKEEEVFSFRLFSSKSAGTSKDENSTAERVAPAVAIDIRSPSPPPVGPDGIVGGFRNPYRDWSYYFTAPELLGQSGGEDKRARREAQFKDIARSGAQVHAEAAKGVYPACIKPHRVMHLVRSKTTLKDSAATPASTLQPPTDSKQVLSIKSSDNSLSRRPLTRRPNKKRRIHLRKLKALEARQNETEAEKRNRRNREKKQKKRERARAEKMAAKGEGAGVHSEEPMTVIVDDAAISQA